MVHKLFEDFLNNEEQYKACERYWEQLVQDIAASLRQVVSGSVGYLSIMPMEPLFDGWSKGLGRAFRIIKHRATGNDLEIAAWLKSYEDEFTDLPANELVINLSLSQESAQLAQVLLHKWMTPTTSQHEMHLLIRQMLHNQ